MKGRYSPARGLTPNQRKRASLAWQELLYTGAKGSEQIAKMRAATPAAPQPRAKPQRKEAPVLKAILHLLRVHPLVTECWRQNAGQIPVGDGRFIRLGDKGKLDIAGRLKDGRYFEIEAKAPGRKPEPHQQARIDYLLSTGAVAGWADNVEQAKRIIEGE